MIFFKDFQKENYEKLKNMMIEFYTSDAVDSPLDPKIVNKLLDDILSEEYGIRGVEAYYEDKLVGFGVITIYYASEVAGITVQLEDLYIEEKYRSRGIAKAYFNRVMEKYPDAKRFRLEVCSSNVNAIKLYKKIGFKVLAYDQMVYDISNKTTHF